MASPWEALVDKKNTAVIPPYFCKFAKLLHKCCYFNPHAINARQREIIIYNFTNNVIISTLGIYFRQCYYYT